MASSFEAELKRKTVEAEEAAALVKPGQWIDYGFGIGQTDVFDRALAARIPQLTGLKIRGTLALKPRAAIEADPEARHVAYFSWYFSGLERKLHDRELCSHIPMNFGEAPDYYRRFVDVDLAVIKTAPMDEHGFFNFGGSVSYLKALTEKARIVIVHTDTAMPYVFGVENAVHIGDVDLVIEGDTQALPELKNSAAGPIERKIAQTIAAEIDDGACLQIGIGAMPNAVCELLLDSPINDLGVHTEMFFKSLIKPYHTVSRSGAHMMLDHVQSADCLTQALSELYAFL